MVFSDQTTDYKTAVHSSGYIRQFFTTLKALTSGPIKRIFITGILPILLNDITSGFNISKPVSYLRSYQCALGFSDNEVKHILTLEGLNTEDIFERIKKFYNGFMFATNPISNTPYAYNPNMVLYYIESLKTSQSAPSFIMSSILLSDQNKFQFFLKNQQNIQQILHILEKKHILSEFEPILDIKSISYPINLATIFFHFGLLTFKKFTPPTVKYKIPNYVTELLYYKYFRGYLRETSEIYNNIQEIINITQSLCNDGDLNPLLNFLQKKVLSDLSFRDTIGLNEKSLKFLFLMFFKFTSFYTVRSEQELFASEKKGGYADLQLIETRQNSDVIQDGIKFEWLFELKYLKITEISELKDNLQEKLISSEDLKTFSKVKTILNDGKIQLKNYRDVYEKNIKDSSKTKYAIILFIGKEFVVSEEI